MSEPALRRGPVIEWGWAGRALERQSGDLHVVVLFECGALVALLDGLGHGPEAAAAAHAAVAPLEAHAGEPIAVLVERCHEALRGTRGAAMTVASFDSREGSMAWTAIGNVDGILLRAHAQDRRARGAEAVPTRGGVVGYRLPSLRVNTVSVSPGDTLVMLTDGIRHYDCARVAFEYSPQEMAESILVRYATGTDDAHVLVARYLGAPT